MSDKKASLLLIEVHESGYQMNLDHCQVVSVQPLGLVVDLKDLAEVHPPTQALRAEQEQGKKACCEPISEYLKRSKSKYFRKSPRKHQSKVQVIFVVL